MIKFILNVIPRTKKNSGQIINNSKTGRAFLLPSKQYLQFEKECLPYLRRVKAEIGLIDYPINLECLFISLLTTLLSLFILLSELYSSFYLNIFISLCNFYLVHKFHLLVFVNQTTL